MASKTPAKTPTNRKGASAKPPLPPKPKRKPPASPATATPAQLPDPEARYQHGNGRLVKKAVQL